MNNPFLSDRRTVLPEIIETERLILRPPCAEDAQEIFERYARDAEVVRYLTWKPVQKIEETQAFVSQCISAWQEQERFPWVMVAREDPSILGMIELRTAGHKAEVGYVLAQSHWGQGFSTEALRAVVERVFATKSIFRVWAVCDVDNVASARVLEKAGMTREGTLHRYGFYPNVSNQPRDVYVYAVVR